MKKRYLVFALVVIIAVLMLPTTVNADTGPKPSVSITFVNMGDELCYSTLLSKYESTGPASVWDGDEKHIYTNGLDKDIWRAFADYKDNDGYYFLQWGWQCNETKALNWGYYPPSPFKILLYYPQSETFIVSEIYERYAFDSYFTVDMNSIDDTSIISLEKSYDYTWETISLVCRIVVTILLEIAIALLFGFRFKKQLLLIGGVNIVTQIALNVALNLTNYYQGGIGFVLNFVLFELVVFAVEAALYALLLNKLGKKAVKLWKPIVYSLCANSASFAIGLVIALLIPGIF